MQSLVDVRIKRLEGNTLPLPEYKTIGSAGFDLMACINKDEVLEAGQIKLIGTGLSFEIPVGYEIQYVQDLGLLQRTVSALLIPRTIDSDYREK